jgi:hypothetical protein
MTAHGGIAADSFQISRTWHRSQRWLAVHTCLVAVAVICVSRAPCALATGTQGSSTIDLYFLLLFSEWRLRSPACGAQKT